MTMNTEATSYKLQSNLLLRVHSLINTEQKREGPMRCLRFPGASWGANSQITILAPELHATLSLPSAIIKEHVACHRHCHAVHKHLLSLWSNRD
jgi:hypothetical protein